MRQCMDSENLHRRLKKIIGQVQAIDRMIDATKSVANNKSSSLSKANCLYIFFFNASMQSLLNCLAKIIFNAASLAAFLIVLSVYIARKPYAFLRRVSVFFV